MVVLAIEVTPVYVGMGTSIFSPCMVSIMITHEGSGLGEVLGEGYRVGEEGLAYSCLLLCRRS